MTRGLLQNLLTMPCRESLNVCTGYFATEAVALFTIGQSTMDQIDAAERKYRLGAQI